MGYKTKKGPDLNADLYRRLLSHKKILTYTFGYGIP